MQPLTALIAALFANAHAAAAHPSPSQFWNPASTAYEASITAMSPKCQDALKKVYADKELDRCLNFNGQNNFTHLFFDNAQNKSVVDNAAIFASQTLCVRPACADATISSNLHALNTSCSAEDLNREKSPAGFLVAGLDTYGIVRSEACLTNTTSFYKAPDSSFSGHPFCFQQLLEGVQQTKGVNFDLPNLTLLLKMDRGLLAKVFRAPESDLNKKNQQAVFCTDCLKASYDLVKDTMMKENKAAFVGAVNDLCGKDFLDDKATFPKSVSQTEAKGIPAVHGSNNTGGDVDESGTNSTTKKPADSTTVVTANTTGAGMASNLTTSGTPQSPTNNHSGGVASARVKGVQASVLVEVVSLGVLFIAGVPLLYA